MIANRNRKRGRNDAEDLGDDDDDGDINKALKEEESDDEMVNGGWDSGNDDDDDAGADGGEGVGKIGDDAEVRLKNGRITSVEGLSEFHHSCADLVILPGEEDGFDEDDEENENDDNGGIPIVPFNLKAVSCENNVS